MKPADRAWLVLAAAITAYEFAAIHKGWELLSEAIDRYRRRARLTTNSGILYLAAHLLRLWPRRLDPLAALAKAVTKLVAR